MELPFGKLRPASKLTRIVFPIDSDNRRVSPSCAERVVERLIVKAAVGGNIVRLSICSFLAFDLW